MSNIQHCRERACGAQRCAPLRGRAEEEAQREAEVKAIEAARYEREMELARQEAEEEKARRKEAYARCGVQAGYLCFIGSHRHISTASMVVSMPLGKPTDGA